MGVLPQAAIRGNNRLFRPNRVDLLRILTRYMGGKRSPDSQISVRTICATQRLKVEVQKIYKNLLGEKFRSGPDASTGWEIIRIIWILQMFDNAMIDLLFCKFDKCLRHTSSTKLIFISTQACCVEFRELRHLLSRTVIVFPVSYGQVFVVCASKII